MGKKFFHWKRLTGAVLSIFENLKIKGQGYHMTKCVQNSKTKNNHSHSMTNMAQNTVLGVMTECDAHYKGGFRGPMCGLGILSQPAGGGFPSTLQRQILSRCRCFIRIREHLLKYE